MIFFLKGVVVILIHERWQSIDNSCKVWSYFIYFFFGVKIDIIFHKICKNYIFHIKLHNIFQPFFFIIKCTCYGYIKKFYLSSNNHLGVEGWVVRHHCAGDHPRKVPNTCSLQWTNSLREIVIITPQKCFKRSSNSKI